MSRINVNTSSKSYDIVFNDSYNTLLDEIVSLDLNPSKIVVLSDENVSKLYLKEVESLFKENFTEVYTYTFPAGEEYKTLETISSFYEFLTVSKIDRKSLLIALGGGVTGDMVGFLAATYLRGIKFIQAPTTLLSQVDSSSGGKTGVDFHGHKNLIGAFYQPELVYINTSTLVTLPKKQFSSGMGEAIKHGYIKDTTYLSLIEENAEKINTLEHTAISNLIKGSCEIKSLVVNEDERENGIRAILNFGHTVGHAVERLKDFELFHGECVAIGMIAEAYISKSLGHITDEDIQRMKKILSLYNLPVTVTGLNAEDIYEQMFYDKKTSHNTLKFGILDKIGSCYINSNIAKEIIINAINEIIV